MVSCGVVCNFFVVKTDRVDVFRITIDIWDFFQKSRFTYLNEQLKKKSFTDTIVIKDKKLKNALLECFEYPAKNYYDYCVILKANLKDY